MVVFFHCFEHFPFLFAGCFYDLKGFFSNFFFSLSSLFTPRHSFSFSAPPYLYINQKAFTSPPFSLCPMVNLILIFKSAYLESHLFFFTFPVHHEGVASPIIFFLSRSLFLIYPPARFFFLSHVFFPALPFLGPFHSAVWFPFP